MENQLTITSVPSNKTEQKAMAQRFIERVTDGDVDPIAAIVQMKSLSETITTFLKDESVKDVVIKECGKYGKGEYASFKGAEVSVKEGGVKYDYSVCHDPQWDYLNEQMQQLKAQMKERETYLHAITKPIPSIDDETGEVFTLYPAAKSSTTTFAVTFKK